MKGYYRRNMECVACEIGYYKNEASDEYQCTLCPSATPTTATNASTSELDCFSSDDDEEEVYETPAFIAPVTFGGLAGLAGFAYFFFFKGADEAEANGDLEEVVAAV
jgi:hypothetical protein